MPKKTRRQKILAQKNRLLQQTHFLATVQDKMTTSPKTQPPKPAESEEDRKVKSFFFQDLKKSAIFISGIIVLEFLIYFASIVKYLKLGM